MAQFSYPEHIDVSQTVSVDGVGRQFEFHVDKILFDRRMDISLIIPGAWSNNAPRGWFWKGIRFIDIVENIFLVHFPEGNGEPRTLCSRPGHFLRALLTTESERQATAFSDVDGFAKIPLSKLLFI